MRQNIFRLAILFAAPISSGCVREKEELPPMAEISLDPVMVGHSSEKTLVISGSDLVEKPSVESMRDFINYLASRPTINREMSRYVGMNDERGNARASRLIDLQWDYGWCKYQDLSEADKNELFKLRLKNYPKLLSYASAKLHSNVRKAGFGFQTPWQYLVNDYNPEPRGVADAEKIFYSTLRKYNVKKCKD